MSIPIMNFKNKNILVIGDSIIDETIIGEAVGVSLESPTLKLKEVERSVSLGGAANVVENILALGASCRFLTPLGNDSYKRYFTEWKKSSDKFWFSPLLVDTDNNVKTRIWSTKGEERYKYLQINKTSSTPYSHRIPTIEHHMKNIDSVVLVDYGLGMFGEVDYIIETAHTYGIPVISSSQMSDRKNRYLLFENSDYMCMNKEESEGYGKSFVGCTTLGAEGCSFSDFNTEISHAGYKAKCVDPCGAGDAFLAAFSLCIVSHLSIIEALAFCNAWAALSTTNIGTRTPNMGDLNEFLSKNHGGTK